MKTDEGSYQLSHVYDKLFAAAATSSSERKSTTSFQVRQQLLPKREKNEKNFEDTWQRHSQEYSASFCVMTHTDM